MSRAKTHRSGDVEYDGKMLFAISGGATSANSTQRLARFVAPCDMDLNVLVTITTLFSNAAATFRVGLISDTDSLLDDYDLTDVAAGIYDLTRDPLMVSRRVTRGQVVVVELTNADTTGVLDFTIVGEPV